MDDDQWVLASNGPDDPLRGDRGADPRLAARPAPGTHQRGGARLPGLPGPGVPGDLYRPLRKAEDARQGPTPARRRSPWRTIRQPEEPVIQSGML